MDDLQRGKVLVVGQFILLGGLLLAPRPRDIIVPVLAFWVGQAMFLAGIAIVIVAFRALGTSLTANPVPLPSAKLVTGGIYRRLRHPIYAGLILLTAGMTLSSWNWIRLVVWVLLVALLIVKMRWEDELLLAKYAAYRKYRESVPALLPRFK